MGETQSETGLDRPRDVDDALTREVDQLARRYPHVSRDEIDRQVHATYRDLDSRATIHSHLVTVTAAHVAECLRDQSPPRQPLKDVNLPPQIGTSTYEDRPAGAPTELDLEQQRAGVDTGTNPVSDQIASPLWVAGLGPPSGDYRRPPARDDRSSDRPGIAARIRSTLARRHR